MTVDSNEMLNRDWGLFVGGDFHRPRDSEHIDVQNPATGSTLATVPAGTSDDVDDAVAAAGAAFETWQQQPPDEYRQLLTTIAERIEDIADELAMLETLENGKPLDQSTNEVHVAADRFRFFAGGIDKFYGDSVAHTDERIRTKTVEPYGVVGVIIPWNWPVMHTADFLSASLAAGNTVVLKPSPQTPLCALRMAELIADVLPAGVVNVVPGGIGPGEALTSHPNVDKLAFTGSDENGAKVLESAAQHITPTMLELGGKNPAIVFPDAELGEAVSTVLASAFYNSGQACTNPERLLLHEDIYDEFLEQFVDRVEKLVVGDGRDDETQIGPLASTAQVEKMESYVDLAQDEGATIAAQAETPAEPALTDGYWASPTVVTDVDPDMRIAQEEVFGPFVGVMSFSDEQEAIDIANDVDYGLSAAVFTTDINRGHRVASELEVGVVGINHPSFTWQGLPFGGQKRSGIGRKNDFQETMREFMQPKSIELDMRDGGISL